ncbi:hypothetical protein M427DRAFT_359606 [Gonapodya prolifera JEL478]|uniref:Uncharacterized protein n=1 Tax=Gonapodya prolifera (strain JEL478) TaxID=1344416 RepID=A0A139AB78_GONPJ|nr:hypothetical protein M427DRAFT_359606 [Gonapodya prolifera JEL478]|eukprot:KXS13909.1 hypothetical protein M427DRAFT_359606 [Gonapodya prolifera JEL478]
MHGEDLVPSKGLEDIEKYERDRDGLGVPPVHNNPESGLGRVRLENSQEGRHTRNSHSNNPDQQHQHDVEMESTELDVTKPVEGSPPPEPQLQRNQAQENSHALSSTNGQPNGSDVTLKKQSSRGKATLYLTAAKMLMLTRKVGQKSWEEKRGSTQEPRSSSGTGGPPTANLPTTRISIRAKIVVSWNLTAHCETSTRMLTSICRRKRPLGAPPMTFPCSSIVVRECVRGAERT